MTETDRYGDVLWPERLPLSAKFDPEWIQRNQMGPNPLWLAELLCEVMDFRTGMRVLDLGCGKALSSIFLAREFGVQVWATDLWINPTENWARICEAGLEDHVVPVYSNARSLPYALGFFDAVVSIDSYIYFGTDDMYLDYLVKYVAPGSQIGMISPGFAQEINGELPEHLRPFWGQDCWSWHSAQWWHQHWARTGLVDVECAENVTEAWEIWRRHETGDDAKVVEADKGQYMGLIRMVGRRRQ